MRPWQEDDLEPFAQLNADPRVREYFPGVLSRQESDASVKLMSDHIQRCGWVFWAASLIESDEFVGFIGLEDVNFTAPFNKLAPAVEIGWRLAFNHWGKGYATEGAIAALQYGFKVLHLKEIVSFTAVPNTRSRHVMEKIGMRHNPKGLSNSFSVNSSFFFIIFPLAHREGQSKPASWGRLAWPSPA